MVSEKLCGLSRRTEHPSCRKHGPVSNTATTERTHPVVLPHHRRSGPAHRIVDLLLAIHIRGQVDVGREVQMMLKEEMERQCLRLSRHYS